MSKRILPLALTALFLVPYGWLAQRSPALGELFNVTFRSQIAHVIGHSLIFAAIGAMALWAAPGLRRRPGLYLGLILAAAVAQEGLQIPSKGGLYLADTLGDILVDLSAATAALLLMYRRFGKAATAVCGGLPATAKEREP